jgi:acid phosphatase family membrane protein YuiD
MMLETIKIDWSISASAFIIMIAGLLGMFIAQLYKVIVHSITEKRFAIDYLMNNGGMPSSHTSTMGAMLTSLGVLQFRIQGGIGYEFAIGVVFSFIVIFDAMGVRWEAGKHAKLLNEIMENESKSMQRKVGFNPETDTLKEKLGHKPMEVLVGAIFGCVIGTSIAWIYILCANIPPFVG